MTAVGGWSEVVGGAGSEATAAEAVGEGLGRGPAADEAARSGVVQGSAVVVCEELGSGPAVARATVAALVWGLGLGGLGVGTSVVVRVRFRAAGWSAAVCCTSMA